MRKSCWGWHRLGENESPGCRDWSTIWENCWESFFFFFSVLETQLRTLYVLGKHLSKELQPSPVFFFFLSEIRHCYVDLVGLELVTILLNVGIIGAYTGVFFLLYSHPPSCSNEKHMCYLMPISRPFQNLDISGS